MATAIVRGMTKQAQPWKANVARGVSDAGKIARPSAWLETVLRAELTMLDAMRAARESV